MSTTAEQLSASSSAIADVQDPARWHILMVVLAAIFMSLMGVSIVNVALASIQQALHASQSDIQWVLSGYALTFGVVLVSAGRAGDLMGRGGFFMIGVAIFTLASVAAGLAQTADQLNLARFIQGVGSGFINPQGVGMIQQYFRGAERGRAFGFFGTAVGVSVAIGPVLGGFLIELGGDSFGWRLTFLVNVPVGLLTLWLGYRWFPRPLLHRPRLINGGNYAGPDLSGQGPAVRMNSHLQECARHDRNIGSTASTRQRQGLSSLDPVGALLLGLGVLAVLFPFVEAREAHLLWLLVPLGLVLFYLWVHWERLYARMGFSPMVDLNIFHTPSYRNGAIIMTLYFLGMTSVWVLVPLFIQLGLGKSALEASLIGIPSALLSAWSANWSGKRVTRIGRAIVVGGLCMTLLGLASSILVVQLHLHGLLSHWWLLGSLALFGLGQGSVISPNQTLTLAEVPIAYAGSSGAIMQTGQRIGTSVGIAVITALVFAVLPHSNWHLAFTLGFVSIMLTLSLALWMSLKDMRMRRSPDTSAAR
ncbi:MFS transporter [Thiopseudomonas denitrificans]|uniref:MFS transporter n=1 Tax=Thiopseudomonas denitrificans TaxID=1501432 RepID=A0A4R6TX87_9GAMM|nr:MFS transporter [Thiopseudomonas denitrificans]TDQ36475.1 MFS transporter [Thiopseudomonas denitrificans]